MPSTSTRICSLHFNNDDIVTQSDDYRRSKRANSDAQLSKRYLKPTAVPSKFPGLPAYLSVSKETQRPTTSALASARLERENRVLQQAEVDFFTADTVHDVNQLAAKLEEERLPEGVQVLQFKDSLSLVSFNQSNQGLAVSFSINISQSLHFTLFKENVHIPGKITFV